MLPRKPEAGAVLSGDLREDWAAHYGVPNDESDWYALKVTE